MDIHDQDRQLNGRMWKLYAAGWAAFILLIGIATQLDSLHKAKFDRNAFLHMMMNVPLALILALIWPLSGWLERKRLGVGRAFLVHVAAVLVLDAVQLPVMLIHFGLTKPAIVYIGAILNVTMVYSLNAAIFHMVRVARAGQRQAAAIERAHALLVASELNALRSKLNPHFLFNTLHSIIALTRKDPGAAETALFQFSSMLRYVLDTEKSGKDRVALDDELDFVRDYLELEALRLGQRLTVDWQLDAAAGAVALPALSVQPLVENSIKHSFNPHSRPGRLLIRTGVDPRSEALTITVGDDGPGADPAAVRASTGLGLRTVHRRLQLEYGQGGALDIDTAPGAGFTVTMTIPSAAA